MTERNLTKDEIRQFAEDGVVKISNCVHPQWVPKLLAVADKQMANPSPWVNDVNAGAAENRLFTDRYLWRKNDTIHQFIRESGCARLAAQALQSRSARFYFDHLLVKEDQNRSCHALAPGCPLLALPGQTDRLHLAGAHARHGRGQLNGIHPGLAP